MNSCAIIILAAGGSSRMGVAKQSLAIAGSTLLRRAVDTAVASACNPVVVILGSRADELRQLLEDSPAQVVINDTWERGMGTSIRAGVKSIQHLPVNAAMIVLCDQPFITTTALDEMVAAHFASGKKITAASYTGALGTPAIFDASLFDELLALKDSQAGKALIHRYPDQVLSINMPAAAIDLDTPDDYQRYGEGNSSHPQPEARGTDRAEESIHE